MTVGIEDGLPWIVGGQLLRGILTGSVILGATVLGEAGRLVDKRSGLRVGTVEGGVPEGTAEVDLSEFGGIWSRDCSSAIE